MTIEQHTLETAPLEVCTELEGAQAKMPDETLVELRSQQPLSDPKLNAVKILALALMEHRDWVPEDKLDELMAAGFDQRHVLEVIKILAQKTMSNYCNHIAATPLDENFSAMARQPGN